MEQKLIVRDSGKLQLWAQRISECKASGKPATEWCRENDINLKTYYYWHRRLIRSYETANETEPYFYDVSRSNPFHRNSRLVATMRIKAASVDVFEGADSETLESIVRALQVC